MRCTNGEAMLESAYKKGGDYTWYEVCGRQARACCAVHVCSRALPRGTRPLTYTVHASHNSVELGGSVVYVPAETRLSPARRDGTGGTGNDMCGEGEDTEYMH